MLLLRVAWRNLWRNSHRTTITLVAISLNTAILIASYALMDGLLLHAISNVTNLATGEVQIHAPDYLPRRSIYDSLADPARILQAARKTRLPATPRSYGYGLLAYETKSAGALFWGIEPKTERTTFDLAGHLAAGDFLSDSPRKGVILGKKLARSLNVAIGSEIVALVQAADGSLGNELFVVTGILKAVGERIDRAAVILHGADFAELFVSGGRVHEIALNTRGRLPLEDVAGRAAQAAPDAEVKTWRQLMPALSDMTNLFDVSIWIFGLIFFLAAGLGVMNTMLMSTFERIPEFGILKALGATPWGILRDVAAEALVLGFMSTALGTLLGVPGAYYLQETGLDTSRFAGGYSLAGVAFDPVWRAAISLPAVLMPVVVMWIICVLASLYPAAIAARIDPVRAIHHV